MASELSAAMLHHPDRPARRRLDELSIERQHSLAPGGGPQVQRVGEIHA